MSTIRYYILCIYAAVIFHPSIYIDNSVANGEDASAPKSRRNFHPANVSQGLGAVIGTCRSLPRENEIAYLIEKAALS